MYDNERVYDTGMKLQYGVNINFTNMQRECCYN